MSKELSEETKLLAGWKLSQTELVSECIPTKFLAD